MTGVQTCALPDRKSTRLNSSHTIISYAVFCLKKKIGAGDNLVQLGLRLRLAHTRPLPCPREVRAATRGRGDVGRTRPARARVFFFFMHRGPPEFPPFPHPGPFRA